MTEPRRRRMVADERRDEIFACAERLFAERTYGEVSTTDIAREAGVARGLLNHYFGTKRDLYLEVVRAAASAPLLDVDAVPEGTTEERVGASVALFLDALSQQGVSWINAGVGVEADLEHILAQAENDTVDRLMRVLRLDGESENRRQVRAVLRSFGQMSRAVGREWLVNKTLTRSQSHDLLVSTLLTIVRDVLPQPVLH